MDFYSNIKKQKMKKMLNQTVQAQPLTTYNLLRDLRKWECVQIRIICKITLSNAEKSSQCYDERNYRYMIWNKDTEIF